MSPLPYSTDEPSAQLWFEQSINAAVYIGAVVYGLHIALFTTTVYFLSRTRTFYRPEIVLVIALFAMATINIICNIRFNELAWIDDRNYPGGPLAFMQEQQALPVDTIGNSAAIMASFLADGFLIFRCWLVWADKPWVLILPFIAYLTSIVLSILTVIAASRPSSSLWAATTLKVSLPYWSLQTTLNAILSILLISRLLWMRKKVISALGEQHAKVYTNFVAITVESAVLYGVISFIFIVLYGLQNTGENLFIPLLAQVECIAPELILLRVAKGIAWSKETLVQARATGSGSLKSGDTIMLSSNSSAADKKATN